MCSLSSKQRRNNNLNIIYFMYMCVARARAIQNEHFSECLKSLFCMRTYSFYSISFIFYLTVRLL